MNDLAVMMFLSGKLRPYSSRSARVSSALSPGTLPEKSVPGYGPPPVHFGVRPATAGQPRRMRQGLLRRRDVHLRPHRGVRAVPRPRRLLTTTAQTGRLTTPQGPIHRQPPKERRRPTSSSSSQPAASSVGPHRAGGTFTPGCRAPGPPGQRLQQVTPKPTPHSSGRFSPAIPERSGARTRCPGTPCDPEWPSGPDHFVRVSQESWPWLQPALQGAERPPTTTPRR